VRIYPASISRNLIEEWPMKMPQTPIFYMKYNFKGDSLYWDIAEREDFEFN
jgi:hypothetical protein